jgi:hypothetical protein
METETLKIKFYESLSDSSINLIQTLLKGSLDFKTDIERIDSNKMHEITGELLIQEKYKFIQNVLIAEIVKDVFNLL